MSRYAGVFKGMNAVAFYSNTGESKAVAEYFADGLRYPLVDIERGGESHYENLVLVFPVHCQNIPYAVKAFLKETQIDNLTAVATYGKMCCGNVLYEIQRKYRMNIVAGAYVPAKHSYLEGDNSFCDFESIIPVIEKTKNPSTVQLPKLYKNPFANLFPKLRSRLGLKIVKNQLCDGCGICSRQCSFNAINAGVTNGKCIRCLKCVATCPNKALSIKKGLPLRLYLRKKKVDKLIIYV